VACITAGTTNTSLFRGLNALEESATTPGEYPYSSLTGSKLEYTSFRKTDRYVTSLTKTSSTAYGRLVLSISDGVSHPT